MAKKVIIIGSGIGGLSSAALLAKEGYEVVVFEKNKDIGGRARVFSDSGFTFDMGPSWYLMPDVFRKFYSLFNKKPEDFFKLIPLDPQYRVFFGKNDFVDIKRDLKENIRTFKKIDPTIQNGIVDYLEKSELIYKSAMQNYVYRNYNSIFDFFDKKLILEGGKLGLHMNLEDYVSKFIKNEKIKKILLYSSVFLGISPKKAPSLFALMSYIDFKMGVFYPDGGIGKIIESLKILCEDYGVKIKTNSSVDKIITKNGKVLGVKIGQNIIYSDIVVSNADYVFSETKLIEKKYRSYDKKYWDKKVIAPSAFIIYLGIKGKIKNLIHHNLSFENDWEKHFDEIFDKPNWPENPSYYICCPSKTDKTTAPKNCENLFILVPVASGLRDDGNIRKKYREKILEHLEQMIGEKIRDRIIYERIYAHNDFAADYFAYKGSALGLAHTLFQSAFFRVGNKSKKLDNLYYVGQYTQPGIGMPMCLISSELVCDRIKNDEKNT